jgi:hypothetical protein
MDIEDGCKDVGWIHMASSSATYAHGNEPSGSVKNGECPT